MKIFTNKILKAAFLLTFMLNSISLFADEGLAVRNAPPYVRTYALLHGGVTGAPSMTSTMKRGEKITGTAAYNIYGFYVSYEAECSVPGNNWDSSYFNYAAIFQSGVMDWYGTMTADSPTLTDKAHWLQGGTMSGGSNFHFHSDNYWFYVKLADRKDANAIYLFENNNDSGSLRISTDVRDSKSESDWPIFTVYRVERTIPLTERTDSYCNYIKYKKDIACTGTESRTVEVWYNGEKVGEQTGDTRFPDRPIAADDLTVSTKTGYLLDKVEVQGKKYIVTLKPSTYTIIFNGNGNTGGSMSEQTFEYPTPKALSPNAFVKTGYHFTSWNTASNGSGTSYGDKAIISKLSSENGARINLYAQWEKSIADMTVSITNLQTEEYVLFTVVGLTGEGKDKKYTVALNSAKTSVSMKDLPTGSYRVTALYWSLSEDVASVVNPTTVTEEHDIAGGYEFKFVASGKTAPQPHSEAFKNNVWQNN